MSDAAKPPASEIIEGALSSALKAYREVQPQGSFSHTLGMRGALAPLAARVSELEKRLNAVLEVCRQHQEVDDELSLIAEIRRYADCSR